MIGSIRVFILCVILFLLSAIIAGPAPCQPPAGGPDQSQTTNTQGNTQARAGDNRGLNLTGDKTIGELQALLASEDATATQIKNKISEVRKARETEKQDPSKAQKDMMELLT